MCSTTADSRVVVVVAGELDHQSAARLGEELETAVSSGARCVETDLRRVDFCDCAGLNALLAARSHSRDAGVRFVVSGPVKPAVARMFQLTGTDSVLLECEAA
ncbi:STAS domain-containing protein [Streptomyces canus]|uniref:STAS domain-containing protein n=1 Tax=Streptomyces canus TaxID=58343 RepID=UPI00369204DB